MKCCSLLWDFFGPSWVSSVQSASISYWLIAAIGEDAAAAVEAAGYGDRCILFPKPANESSETAIPGRGKRHRHHHRGAATSATSTTGTSTSRSDHSAYRWLSAAWKGATWGKVAAVTALVDLGFDVVHSDVDVSWFRDPLPLFLSLGETRGPTPAAAGAPGPTAVFSTDLLTTTNKATDGADSGLERSCIPSYSLNTGVYWVRGSETGSRLMNGWMAVKAAGYTGDDQQGLNLLVRGDVEGVVVGCLPVSSFSHTYAFATTELHKVRQHPLYEVHWVWAGKSLESKRQCMRDARVYDDPPEYYRPSRIMTFELEHVELPPGYNTWPASRTADMVTFSLAALSAQLQQAYWALALAAALNRTLVLPKASEERRWFGCRGGWFRCYCAKTWFATSACRITSERDTVFPFTCPLSHVFRARLLSGGDLRVADPLLGDIRPGGGWRVAESGDPRVEG
ncbi:hypothetical protein VOLCADRAFT_94646 [Volvox carteri f. nagariensis]|uniref:Nucleotide-diphospho-sugar transferase domain-containing protein n=1 Tax=Volvox carteri f. nagariensis TaxID=3068 RepID=D8U5C5_VOLCA|nr:uncharacterized protein VOLCADRAFT_94646 [Volvox carteri f. nagariensis]EFJ45189.1 hypothetical protein VOLCADRAFT_94646 [Volvox carteri f. nagariensis]|eukprot:XP_002953865.1 hypothetical protein VOLCADRAFT_94646 [Volvox carteri f. nagariensis]